MKDKNKRVKVLMGVILISLSALVLSPLIAVSKEFTIMIESHFVPAFEEEVNRQVQRWAQEKDVKARVDWVSTREWVAAALAEVESQKGHDLVFVKSFDTGTYKDNLIALNEIAEDLAQEHWGWSYSVNEVGFIDGRWVAIPWFIHTHAPVYRTDYFQEIGVTRDMVFEATWNDVLDWAKKLRAIGHPLAIPFGHNYDSDVILAALLWSFGGVTVNEKGEAIINSPGTAEACKYVKELCRYMPEEIYGWTEGSNNRFMLSGYGSFTTNPPSIYAAALTMNPELAGRLQHAPNPSGPAGRFRCGDVWGLGVWNFTSPDRQELAKSLIHYLMEKGNWYAQLVSSHGYNQPTLKEYTAHPIWRQNVALHGYEPMIEEFHLIGYRYGPAAETKKIFDLHILPIMFEKAARVTTIPEAITWAENELEKIFRK